MATIRYLRDSFFAARRYRDLDDLNAQLGDWIGRIADARVVPGSASRELVRDARERERALLVPLPEHRFASEHVAPIASGKTPYVRFDRNDYSIPHTLVRKPLTLAASLTTVRVLDGSVEVARHARSFDAGRRLELAAHLDDLTAQKRHAHALRGRDRLRAECPAAEDFFKTLAERGDHLTRPAVRLGQLLDQYGATALERALRTALERGSVSAESVAYLLGEGSRAAKAAPPVEVPLPDDPRVRVHVRPHALDAYDRLTRPHDPEPNDE